MTASSRLRSRHSRRFPRPPRAIVFEQLGGAVARAPAGDTAVNFRKAPFNMLIVSMWDNPANDAENRDWARAAFAAMAPHAADIAYVNYLGAESRRRRRPPALLLRPRKARSPGGHQGEIRSRQPLPAQPEHQAGGRLRFRRFPAGRRPAPHYSPARRQDRPQSLHRRPPVAKKPPRHPAAPPDSASPPMPSTMDPR